MAKAAPAADTLVEWMLAQARVGILAKATETARDVLTKYRTTEGIVFNAGATFAIAAEAAGRKKRTEHLAEARGLVGRLARVKGRRFTDVATEPDFESLRAQPDFKTRYAALRGEKSPRAGRRLNRPAARTASPTLAVLGTIRRSSGTPVP